MFVMLIIFMVATPMMSFGLDVDLPQDKQVESLSTDFDHMVLKVRRDGALFLDEYRVDSLDQLEGYLKSLVKEKNKTLFLQADKEVPYGIVVDVMGRTSLSASRSSASSPRMRIQLRHRRLPGALAECLL